MTDKTGNVDERLSHSEVPKSTTDVDMLRADWSRKFSLTPWHGESIVGPKEPSDEIDINRVKC